MTGFRVPLYDRLPEIYRLRDGEQLPSGQVAAYFGAVEGVFSALHENIEALYADLFIETCDPWVIPYIADLLGTSHLKGETRTIRADVADTIALRRRKGTLGAIERLAANLTGWPARAVEMRPNLTWAQHLNHQRPDAGGAPPWGGDAVTRFTPRRGGTVAVRDPAMLSLIGTPFDPFACTPDVKRADDGARHVNLPNLAIWLWRLAAYRLAVTRPLLNGVQNLGPPPAAMPDRARFAVRVDLDPLDRPVRLFQSYERPAEDPATGVAPLTAPDAVCGPIVPARLESTSEAGNSAAYVSVDIFEETADGPAGLDLGDVGLQVYLPDSILRDVDWLVRSANLCAWEDGLDDPLRAHDLYVDPIIGRLLFGVASAAERNGLVTTGGSPEPRLYAGYTYGAVGPIGAHPVSRDPSVAEGAELRLVNALDPAAMTLTEALSELDDATGPVLVEIADSLVHDLDPGTLPGAVTEDGLTSLRLAHPLTIRAASGARPVVRLAAPLAFRPVDPAHFDVRLLTVTLEGLFVARGVGFAPADGPVIARAALARLTLSGVTLDPGGHLERDGSVAPVMVAMQLDDRYGFETGTGGDAELDAFAPTPDVTIAGSVTGPLQIGDGYSLALQDSVVDAGRGPGDAPGLPAAISADDGSGHGPPLTLRNVTVLGAARVREATGSGGIFAQRLEVWNHQKGCLKYCSFSGRSDVLPPQVGCVSQPGAALRFTSIRHGQPGYAQLARTADAAIRTRGPGDDAMGATGVLLEAHRWTNLNTRLREFMPVGVRPLVVPVT